MKNFVRYDQATGRILAVGQVPESMIELQGEGVLAMEADPRLDYIVDGAAVRRPDMQIVTPRSVKADGTDELIIADVPAGATLRVRGPLDMEGVTEKAGDVTLTFALTGTYTLLIECFPFNDAKVTIHAV